MSYLFITAIKLFFNVTLFHAISVHIFHWNKNLYTLFWSFKSQTCTVQILYIHNSYHDTEPRERRPKKRSSPPCSYAKYFANMSAALCEFYFAACIFAEVGSFPTSHILHQDAVWQKKTGSQATRPYPIHPEVIPVHMQFTLCMYTCLYLMIITTHY